MGLYWMIISLIGMLTSLVALVYQIREYRRMRVYVSRRGVSHTSDNSQSHIFTDDNCDINISDSNGNIQIVHGNGNVVSSSDKSVFVQTVGKDSVGIQGNIVSIGSINSKRK